MTRLTPTSFRATVPVFCLVLSSVLFLFASGLMAIGRGSLDLRLTLFLAGLGGWIFGIGWGLIANATPPAPSTRD